MNGSVALESKIGGGPPKERRRWWRLPLGIWSLLAVGAGALIGTVAPSVGEGMKILGDIFLNLVQMVVIPLVFPLIVLGISRMESVKKVGRIAGKAILAVSISAVRIPIATARSSTSSTR